MFRFSKNGNIELTRGDTCKVPILINFGDKLHPNYYRMTETDKFYFSIMQPNETFETAILKKKLDYTSQSEEYIVTVKLSSLDTQNLLPGRYYYTAKLVYSDGEDDCVKTVIPECEFYIL